MTGTKEAPTVDFFSQNAQFFYQLDAKRWPMRIPTPTRDRRTASHARTVGRTDERLICKVFPASEWDARKEPNR
jgi:hypothetical protein